MLRSRFFEELKEYKEELQMSNQRSDHMRAQRLISNFNPDYADKLLYLYHERCKFRHALAFL